MIILPTFDHNSYEYAKNNILNDKILKESLNNYLLWVEKEKKSVKDKYKPSVPISITDDEIKSLGTGFIFSDITNYVLEKYQILINKIMDNSLKFPKNPLSLNYILLQINEIGIDKANDIGFISYNTNGLLSNNQEFIIKGERMKFEYGLALASSYCLSLGADIVYYHRNEDFKWK